MDRERATEIANSWYEKAREREQIGNEYQNLARLLRATLPDDTETVAGAPIAGQPAVVALAGDGFFLITLEPRDDSAQQPVVERLPLSPAPTLGIRDGWREDASAGARGGAGAHVREWTLTWPHGRVVSFESVFRRVGGFHDGPDDADAFGRALAARLGWAMPT